MCFPFISNHPLDDTTALRCASSAALTPVYHTTISIGTNHHVPLPSTEPATPFDLLAFGRNRIQPSYVGCGASLCARCSYGRCNCSMHCCFLLVLLRDPGGSCWTGWTQRRQRDPFGRKNLVGSVAFAGAPVIEGSRKSNAAVKFDCAMIVMIHLCSIATARTTFHSGMVRRFLDMDPIWDGIPPGRSYLG
jgi:hypothetical protein